MLAKWSTLNGGFGKWILGGMVLELRRGMETADEVLNQILPKGIPHIDENLGLPKPDLLQKYLSKEGFNRRDRLRQDYRETRNDFQRHEHDTGSPEVQAAVLTKKIKALEQHMTNNRQDKSAIKNMQKLISSRRKLLVYLRRTKFDLYCTVIERLKLKDTFIKQDRFAMYKAKVGGQKYL